ncbi:MAG: RNA polymerase sigma factor [Sedimentisphaerales bacterium]|nr:RNA polymerase sigma factor [Sedimentisphaerales bacterium]
MVMIVGTIKLRRVISVDNGSKVDDDSQITVRTCYDSKTFVQLYRSHYDEIFRYCAHRLFERTKAEDVTSEVFLKAVENFHGFKGNEQQFRCWLYRIATNAVNNHLRKIARRKRLLKFAHEHSNSQDADCEEPADKLALLKEAVFTLNPRYQTIITLRFFENLKLTEIAEVLGSSPGTVRSQLTRALAKLRKVLGTEFTGNSEVN